MKLTLFTADCTGNRKNCLYPNRIDVSSAGELEKAIRYDHVCAEYRNSYRSVENFMVSHVVVMDCDNEHSDRPEDWITPEKLDDRLADISYALAPSRHDNLPKDGKSARPRLHVYFPISKITDPTTYASLKRTIHAAFPFFDGNALDAARFIFGSDRGRVIWHEGWMNIDEILSGPSGLAKAMKVPFSPPRRP